MITWTILTFLSCLLVAYFCWIHRKGIALGDGFKRYPASIVGRLMFGVRTLALLAGLAGMFVGIVAVPILIVAGLLMTVRLFSASLADAMPSLPLVAFFFLGYCGFLVYQGRYGKGSACYERRMRHNHELQWFRQELGLAARQSFRERAKKILKPVLIIWIILLLLGNTFYHHRIDPRGQSNDVYENGQN